MTHDDNGEGVGLNWFVTSTNIFWHNGGTYGNTSFVGFDPTQNKAVVVLADTSSSVSTPIWSDVTEAQASWFWYYPLRLYPTSPNSFLLRVLNGSFTFQVDGQGMVTGFTLLDQGQTFTGTKQ